MIGRRVSRFKTEDCVLCQLPFETFALCEFCDSIFCEDCKKYWKTCANCGREGCKEHFDGMYCKECHKDKLEEVLMNEPEVD